MEYSHYSDINTSQEIPKARFTGIFIPVDILEIKELNPSEIILLSWIDALQCEKSGGCFASNDYFAERLHLKVNTISLMITKLKDLGLVKQVSFDGRRRILIAYTWFDRQSKADFDYNQRQSVNKIKGCTSVKSKSHNIYSKGEIKGKHIEAAPPVCVLDFGSHVKLKQSEYDELTKIHGQTLIDQTIETINDYCDSKGKIYKGYAATIRNFIKRSAENPKIPHASATSDRNREAALKAIKELKSPYGYLEDTGTHLAFINFAPSSQPFYLAYSDGDFKNIYMHNLKKWSFKLNE